MNTIEIAGRKIGDGHPCFVIAEAGVNHNGSLDLARKLVDAAAQAGADAVKFQTFKAASVISACAPKANYQKETTGDSEQQLEMVRRLEMSADMTRTVAAYARASGIIFLSTPFDEESLELLSGIGVPAFKVGSGDLTALPWLELIARKNKPVILSTGMAYLEEVRSAVTTLQGSGCSQIALLHCVSSYPADPESANLAAMKNLRDTFDLPAGFSDHFLENDIAIAAVALGAHILEKHITLDENLPGPDHRVSLSPQKFTSLVRSIRTVESARGDGIKRPTVCEQNVRAVAQRSIVAARVIPAGVTITREMLAFKRPGTGISPAQWTDVVGKCAIREIASDALITTKDFA